MPWSSASGRGRAAGHVDVDGDELVDALGHGVRVPVRATGVGAGAERDDVLRLGHLVVEAPDRRGHLVGDRAGDDHEVGLARARSERDDAEADEVVAPHRGRDELDGAAGEAEVEDPQRVAAAPVEHDPDRLRGVLGDGPHPGHRQVDAHDWHPSPMGRDAGGAAERRPGGSGWRATEAPVGPRTPCSRRSGRSSPGRRRPGRREFATGRHCARLALASPRPRSDRDAGARATRAAHRCGRRAWSAASRTAPGGPARSWPARRGSGSGARRPRASVSTPSRPVPLPTGVLEVVASDGERTALARLGGERPGIPWDTVLFSAKEATYKAWYPLTGIVVAHDAVSRGAVAVGRVHGRRRRGRPDRPARRCTGCAAGGWPDRGWSSRSASSADRERG